MSRSDVERHQLHHGFIKVPLNAPESLVVASKPLRLPKQPNKTESAFRAYMEHLWHGANQLEFEPVKLRIGPNCYYAPDWGLMGAGKPIFYEVKGAHIWEDSMVKFKAAKERHTWASFELWQKKQGSWSRLL